MKIISRIKSISNSVSSRVCGVRFVRCERARWFRSSIPPVLRGEQLLRRRYYLSRQARSLHLELCLRGWEDLPVWQFQRVQVAQIPGREFPLWWKALKAL